MPLSGKNNLDILRNDIVNAVNIVAGKSLMPIDEEFIELLRKYNARRLTFRMPEFVNRQISPFTYDHNNRATLLFSGGRVSLATALWLKDMDKDIELVYIDNGHKAEVETLMARLQLPYSILSSRVYDNDFSAMLMLHDVLEYAISNHHAPVLYIGCFDEAIMDNNKSRDWRYCHEFIDTYNKLVRKYVDGAKVLCLFPDYRVVDDELLKHPEYQYIQ